MRLERQAHAKRLNLPSGTVIEDRDFSRAFIVVWCPSVYQPVELLRTFCETDVPRLEEDAPSWLTPEFRALIDTWTLKHARPR